MYEDTGSSLVLRQSIFGGVAGAHLGVGAGVSGEDLLVYYRTAPTQFGIRAFRHVNGTWVLAQVDAAPVGQLSGGVELDHGLAVARKSGGGFCVLANAGMASFRSTRSHVPSPVPRSGTQERAKMTPAQRTTGAHRRSVTGTGTPPW